MMTLWRKLLYQEINKLQLNDEILDLGGTKKVDYHKLIRGTHRIISANIAGDADLLFDFEQKFPIDNEQYDVVVCLNVLEHIFNYQNILSEVFRILKPDGQFVMAVPFIIAIHPDPDDYWRFSNDCLRKLLKNQGFKDIKIKEIGYGVFSSACNLKYNVLKFNFLRKSAIVGSIVLDKILSLLLSAIGVRNLFTEKNYPLGYFVTAKR